MSVQFGKWNFDGKPQTQDHLEKVKSLLAPYGPDGKGFYSREGISILYCAFHTALESRRETQPQVTASGAAITWDGRLDNRTELIQRLGDAVTARSTDVEIVAAAHEYWGSACFAMLIGDWALSIWDPHTRSLILAKDPIGTRHLYYSFDSNRVTWSTVLDPLVLFAGKTFALCEEYIAGWFSFFPAAHLTPYVGIQSVPPSSFVLLRPGRHAVTKYWDFDPNREVRYRTDAEYEDHFRAVFGEAVRRRLRSDSPVLAELSGGMDSSSIVCMADTIIARGAADAPRLDTVSYYNDSEPNWNERPYFTKVEEKRGRAGCHIEVGTHESIKFEHDSEQFAATPGSSTRLTNAYTQLLQYIHSQGNRVLLSGIGGDEATGGVPTPIPELQDLLVKADFRTLCHQLKTWALYQRRPWFHLLFEATRGFFPPSIVGLPEDKRPAWWLNPSFVGRNPAALQGYEKRLVLFGPRPSFQHNIHTLNALQRQLACDAPLSDPPYETRYPFLDRTLLEFLYSVPREQLVRAGQRRSLMRRALAGIVPEELLNRKRKAFVARVPLAAISTEWLALVDITSNMICSSLSIVESRKFREALQNARDGKEVSVVALMRTLGLEGWFRQVHRRGQFSKPNPAESDSVFPSKTLPMSRERLHVRST